MFGHPFVYLRAVLGSPSRTFRYIATGVPNIEDHVWRCGCAAREICGACELVACSAHGLLDASALATLS